MTILTAVVRLLLAAVFVVSAVAKLRDREGSREAVEAFRVPGPLVGVVTAGLPVAELACAALLLLPDPFATVGAVVSLLLLAAFTAAIVTNLLKGRRPACNCFGSLGDGGGIGWHTVARNGVLLVLAALSLVGAGDHRSVPGELSRLSGEEALVVAGFVVLLAAVAVLAAAVQTLVRKYGEVLLRLDTLEQATGLAEPVPAPAFTLPDLDGVETSLDELVAEGRPTLVAFVSPGCSNCTDVLPDLLAWQSDEQHPLTVAVVTDGPVTANRNKIADVGPLRMLVDDSRLLYEYGAEGTPAAVLVDADGRLASPPMHGVDGVRTLHDNVVANLGTPAAPAPAQHLHDIQPRPVVEGDPMPELALRDELEREVEPAELLGDDAVLLFWRTDCGFCQQIIDDVVALQDSVPLRVVTGSDVDVLRDTGITADVVRDPQMSLEAWLHVPGTPSAARVRDGALASTVAVGGPEVLALLRSAARTPVDD